MAKRHKKWKGKSVIGSNEDKKGLSASRCYDECRFKNTGGAHFPDGLRPF